MEQMKDIKLYIFLTDHLTAFSDQTGKHSHSFVLELVVINFLQTPLKLFVVHVFIAKYVTAVKSVWIRTAENLT
jgi:hypothetical protein